MNYFLCALIVYILPLTAFNSNNNISLFGDSVISEREDQIAIQYQYGAVSSDITATILATGLIQSLTSMAIVSTGTGATGFAQIQSNKIGIYDPGHEMSCFFTAMWPNGSATNSTQWIGTFTTTDGVAVGFNGTTFSILFRQEGVDTTIPQASFNRDLLNGTGSSGFTLDTATLNVFRIAYGWLGANQINFFILGTNQQWILFHSINRTNSFSAPSFTNPMLPITAEVQKTAGSSNLVIATACWNLASIATNDIVGNRYFTVTTPSTVITTEAYMLAISNKSTYQSRPNTVSVTITLIETGAISTVASSVLIRAYKNARIGATAFTDVDTQNSVTEFSTLGTYSIGSGTLVLALASKSLGNGPFASFIRRKTPSPQNIYNIILLPGETLTITGLSILGGATTASISVAWAEQFS